MNPGNDVQFPYARYWANAGYQCLFWMPNKISLVDSEPPTIPKGIILITGNRQIAVEWFPNGEQDLAGYHVW